MSVHVSAMVSSLCISENFQDREMDLLSWSQLSTAEHRGLAGASYRAALL